MVCDIFSDVLDSQIYLVTHYRMQEEQNVTEYFTWKKQTLKKNEIATD